MVTEKRRRDPRTKAHMGHATPRAGDGNRARVLSLETREDALTSGCSSSSTAVVAMWVQFAGHSRETSAMRLDPQGRIGMSLRRALVRHVVALQTGRGGRLDPSKRASH